MYVTSVSLLCDRVTSTSLCQFYVCHFCQCHSYVTACHFCQCHLYFKTQSLPRLRSCPFYQCHSYVTACHFFVTVSFLSVSLVCQDTKFAQIKVMSVLELKKKTLLDSLA
uniref:Uncharacterized protein n=1 Tax=Cacopsylla melanoneura TaxID=428564 RepID=A0A8D8WZK4_9HEMI